MRVQVVDRGRVDAVREAMPPDADVEQAADVFALLGDPNRLRLRLALPAARANIAAAVTAVQPMSSKL